MGKGAGETPEIKQYNIESRITLDDSYKLHTGIFANTESEKRVEIIIYNRDEKGNFLPIPEQWKSKSSIYEIAEASKKTFEELKDFNGLITSSDSYWDGKEIKSISTSTSLSTCRSLAYKAFTEEPTEESKKNFNAIFKNPSFTELRNFENDQNSLKRAYWIRGEKIVKDDKGLQKLQFDDNLIKRVWNVFCRILLFIITLGNNYRHTPEKFRKAWEQTYSIQRFLWDEQIKKQIFTDPNSPEEYFLTIYLLYYSKAKEFIDFSDTTFLTRTCYHIFQDEFNNFLQGNITQKELFENLERIKESYNFCINNKENIEIFYELPECFQQGFFNTLIAYHQKIKKNEASYSDLETQINSWIELGTRYKKYNNLNDEEKRMDDEEKRMDDEEKRMEELKKEIRENSEKEKVTFDTLKNEIKKTDSSTKFKNIINLCTNDWAREIWPMITITHNDGNIVTLESIPPIEKEHTSIIPSINMKINENVTFIEDEIIKNHFSETIKEKITRTLNTEIFTSISDNLLANITSIISEAIPKRAKRLNLYKNLNNLIQEKNYSEIFKTDVDINKKIREIILSFTDDTPFKNVNALWKKGNITDVEIDNFSEVEKKEIIAYYCYNTISLAISSIITKEIITHFICDYCIPELNKFFIIKHNPIIDATSIEIFEETPSKTREILAMLFQGSISDQAYNAISTFNSTFLEDQITKATECPKLSNIQLLFYFQKILVSIAKDLPDESIDKKFYINLSSEKEQYSHPSSYRTRYPAYQKTPEGEKKELTISINFTNTTLDWKTDSPASCYRQIIVQE